MTRMKGAIINVWSGWGPLRISVGNVRYGERDPNTVAAPRPNRVSRPSREKTNLNAIVSAPSSSEPRSEPDGTFAKNSFVHWSIFRAPARPKAKGRNPKDAKRRFRVTTCKSLIPFLVSASRSQRIASGTVISNSGDTIFVRLDVRRELCDFSSRGDPRGGRGVAERARTGRFRLLSWLLMRCAVCWHDRLIEAARGRKCDNQLESFSCM
ncbi:MAG: hypothetical protein Q9172_006352 [Xanthocarpia lactea]